MSVQLLSTKTSIQHLNTSWIQQGLIAQEHKILPGNFISQYNMQ